MAFVSALGAEESEENIYILEYYHNESRAKLPRVMYDNCIASLPSRVKLFDPVGNPFTVHVEREENCAYFASGWNDVGLFYGLKKGGWISMPYTKFGEFAITVTNLSFGEVRYPPYHGNAMNALERIMVTYDDDDDEMDIEFSGSLLFDHLPLICIANRNLSYEEVSGKTLSFSKIWSEAALPRQNGHLSLVDEYGVVFPCYYVTHLAGVEGGSITRGWKRFCRKKGLTEDQSVQFGVISNNSNVLHFTPRY